MAILKTGKEIGVCIHHSVYKPAANLAELKAQAALFNGWHKGKSWAETTKTDSAYPYISYHWLVATNGDMLNTTNEKYVKYAAGDNFRGDMSFNLHGTHICLTGNYENDKPTPEMERALALFIKDYQKRKGIDAYVRGHKETSKDATACPGTNIGTSKSGWLKQVITNVNNSAYPPVEPPAPPVQTECEKEIERLKGEVTRLSEALAASQANEKSKGERIEFLEGTLAVREGEMVTLEGENERLFAENERFEKEKNDAIAELNAYKEGRKNWFAELLERLFKKDN